MIRDSHHRTEEIFNRVGSQNHQQHIMANNDDNTDESSLYSSDVDVENDVEYQEEEDDDEDSVYEDYETDPTFDSHYEEDNQDSFEQFGYHNNDDDEILPRLVSRQREQGFDSSNIICIAKPTKLTMKPQVTDPVLKNHYEAFSLKAIQIGLQYPGMVRDPNGTYASLFIWDKEKYEHLSDRNQRNIDGTYKHGRYRSGKVNVLYATDTNKGGRTSDLVYRSKNYPTDTKFQEICNLRDLPSGMDAGIVQTTWECYDVIIADNNAPTFHRNFLKMIRDRQGFRLGLLKTGGQSLLEGGANALFHLSGNALELGTHHKATIDEWIRASAELRDGIVQVLRNQGFKSQRGRQIKILVTLSWPPGLEKDFYVKTACIETVIDDDFDANTMDLFLEAPPDPDAPYDPTSYTDEQKKEATAKLFATLKIFLEYDGKVIWYLDTNKFLFPGAMLIQILLDHGLVIALNGFDGQTIVFVLPGVVKTVIMHCPFGICGDCRVFIALWLVALRCIVLQSLIDVGHWSRGEPFDASHRGLQALYNFCMTFQAYHFTRMHAAVTFIDALVRDQSKFACLLNKLAKTPDDRNYPISWSARRRYNNTTTVADTRRENVPNIIQRGLNILVSVDEEFEDVKVKMAQNKRPRQVYEPYLDAVRVVQALFLEDRKNLANDRWKYLLPRIAAVSPELAATIKSVRDTNVLTNLGNRTSLNGCGRYEVALNDRFFEHLFPQLNTDFKAFFMVSQDQDNRVYGMARLGGTLATTVEQFEGVYPVYHLSYESFRQKLKPDSSKPASASRRRTSALGKRKTNAVRSQIAVPTPTHLLPTPCRLNVKNHPNFTAVHNGVEYVLLYLKERE